MTVHVRRLSASDDAALYLRLNNGALAAAGIDPDTPVTVELPGPCTVAGVVKTSGGSPWLAPGRRSSNAAITETLRASGFEHGDDVAARLRAHREQAAPATPPSRPPVGGTLSGLHTLGAANPAPADPEAVSLSGATVAASPSSPALTRLQPGSLFHDRYEIRAVIGEGGMGLVYRVHDQLTDKEACLKIVRPELVGSDTMRRRFLREGALARDLRHENIVAVYDVNTASGLCYLTMEFVPGRTLRAWMREQARSRAADSPGVSLAVARNILFPLLSGLDAAHRRDVVHRDIKPENVMLLVDPSAGEVRLKILDFGIARAAEAQTNLTRAGAPLGTFAYMAPEQATDPDTVGPQADVYAAGAILYELLTDVPPQGRWDLPSEIRSDLPSGVDDLCQRALATHASRRFPDAAGFRDALDALDVTAASPSTSGRAEPSAPAPATEPAPVPSPSRPATIPPWAESIPDEPLSGESGDDGHARAVRHRDTGIEMLLVPAGSYMRGSPDSDGEAHDNERPQHRVTISKPFYLGRYEVTQAEWRRVTGKSPSRFSGDRRPVERVSWNDIQPFLEATGLRLPTEAEWEYACRAGTTGPRYGNLDAIAWHDGNSGGRTHDLGGKAPNPWGFYDMLGNVWEWCGDGWDEDAYSGCKDGVTDPVVSVGSSRVVRGGSWHFESRYCRSANRYWVDPTCRFYGSGFRVARAP